MWDKIKLETRPPGQNVGWFATDAVLGVEHTRLQVRSRRKQDTSMPFISHSCGCTDAMLAVQLTTPLRMHDTTGRHHMYRECLMNLQV